MINKHFYKKNIAQGKKRKNIKIIKKFFYYYKKNKNWMMILSKKFKPQEISIKLTSIKLIHNHKLS